jgi:hypothetical protein
VTVGSGVQTAETSWRGGAVMTSEVCVLTHLFFMWDAQKVMCFILFLARIYSKHWTLVQHVTCCSVFLLHFCPSQWPFTTIKQGHVCCGSTSLFLPHERAPSSHESLIILVFCIMVGTFQGSGEKPKVGKWDCSSRWFCIHFLELQTCVSACGNVA